MSPECESSGIQASLRAYGTGPGFRDLEETDLCRALADPYRRIEEIAASQETIVPRATSRISCLSLAVLAGGLVCVPVLPGFSSVAMAQHDAEEKTELELLRDFAHFVRLGAYDVAEGIAGELLDRGLTDIEFVDLVEDSRERDRFDEAVASAMRAPQLEELAAEMDRKYRGGKLARARMPDEVTRNINFLAEGGLRARTIAKDRLLSAGEYAMPQLLEAYLAQGNPRLKAEVQKVIVEMGRQAIMPMTAALPGLDPARQEAVAELLGLVDYRTSLPALTRLYQESDVEAVREACEWSIGRLEGAPNMDTANLYYSLGEAYYDERSELTSFPREKFQLLWDFDPTIGLIPTAIVTEAYHEAMAMRMAEQSLRLDPRQTEAVALWIAANYSREIDSPDGYANPAYPPERRDAEYFAVAAGTDISQRVLARAIDDGDTPLSRRAIAAIEMTAGGPSLWGPSQRRPLLEALAYPNRRVQYEAALALGAAQPVSGFEGSERVVPLLASAVRDAAARYAIVMTGSDREEYDRHRQVLEGEGYIVLPPAERGLEDLRAAIAEAPGVDLIITSLGADPTRGVIEEIRSDSKLAVTPVLAMTPADEMEYLSRLYRRDQSVMVRRTGIDGTMFVQASSDLIEAASGGVISESEAAAYADRAISTLRDLAVSQNRVLDVSDAAAPLIAVMGDQSGRVMLDIGEVLAHVDQVRAQSALINRALEISGEEQRAMLGLVADSGKRYGNSLDDRQIRRLIELARSTDYELATSAAAVMGAMQLPNEDLLPIMFGEFEGRSARARRP